jgi:hypothetical protein
LKKYRHNTKFSGMSRNASHMNEQRNCSNGVGDEVYQLQLIVVLLTVDFGTPSYKFTVNICTYLKF